MARTMARPRGGDWLVDEMAGLREAGVDVLVSALCDDEYALLDLSAEADAGQGRRPGVRVLPHRRRRGADRGAWLHTFAAG